MLEAALAKYLDANVADLTFDPTGVSGNMFVATMPTSPDEAVAVMPTGGNPQLSRLGYDEPTVQFLVRGPAFDPRPPLATARAIYSALQCLDLVTLDDGGIDEVFLHACTAQQSGPIPLGMDENQRFEWSLNFACSITSPTTHRVS